MSSGVVLSYSPAQAGPPIARCSGPWLLYAPRERDSTASLGNPCQCTVTFTGKKCFLIFGGNLMCLILCPSPLILPLGTTDKSRACLLCALSSGICYTDKIPHSLFWAYQSRSSQLFIAIEVLQHVNNFCDPLLDLFQYIHVSLALGNPELDAALQDWLQ